ncbi:MAG: hypothetical protein ACYTGL_02090 [Planctomycetota bacterium]|jgi:uncharacterized membrane protein YgcG
MKSRPSIPFTAIVTGLLSVATVTGCSCPTWLYKEKWTMRVPVPCPPAPAPLGSSVVSLQHAQEINSEANDFVVYDHEFVKNETRLTPAGEDHVRQIAARMEETGFPVIVEQTENEVDPSSTYKYPVANDADLDTSRRDLVVQALNLLGVQGADSRVIVGPSPSFGLTGNQAIRAYNVGFSGRGSGRGGGFGGGGIGGGFSGGSF